MKVLYLGTGAAEGIPACFCNCAFCRGARLRGEVRTRAQVLYGDLSVDFPPDAYYHAVKFGVDLSALRYLAVTHAHMDHFYVQDFVLRGYKYAKELSSSKLEIFANAEALEVFEEGTRREMKPEVRRGIVLHPICSGRSYAFGGWKLTALPACHSSREPLVFLLERDGRRILHLTDTGLLPEAAYAILEKQGGAPIDLITFDCTFLYGETAEGARHMGLDANAKVLARLEEMGLADGHTKRVITHFSHNAEPTALLLRRAEEEYGVIAAYDGMALEI